MDRSTFSERKNLELLLNISPDAQRIDFDEDVLVYHFDSDYLPPKPWPKKIAGVPCYLTSDEY